MKKTKTIVLGILIILCAVLIFFNYPNLNPLYGDGLAFWAVVLTVFALALWITGSAGRLADIFSRGQSRGGFHGAGAKGGFSRTGRIYLAVIAVPWAALILVSIFSMVLFNQGKYKNQLPQPEVRKFAADVQPIDISQLPVVDYDLAKLLADKKLGEKPSLGSQVTLGDPTIQKVDGKLEWIVPLEHSGFFKWISNMSGTPGYIVVSATNPRDVTYVDRYSIKIQPNAYLLDNLSRYARFAGGLFKGLTDYSFEVDDSGKPYWVVTTYKNTAGFSLPEADGVLLIDAQTGKTARYGLKNVPGWVDRVQPESFLMNQINNRGKYIHGIFNFSNKDKFQTSEGNAIIYNNGRCYLFTGLTSVGGDESATGFMLVDMVSKKPYLYQMSGATEYAAQQSAQGKVQNLHYVASFPLVTNVDGQATYFMTLKDDAGLIKQYAFVSVTDYTTVGTGESIQDALNNFEMELKNTGGSSGIVAGNQKQTAEGTVSRIASEISGGNTVYKIILAEQPDKIFTAVADLSDELALTRDGDKVKMTYTRTDKPVIEVSTFDNEMFTQK